MNNISCILLREVAAFSGQRPNTSLAVIDRANFFQVSPRPSEPIFDFGRRAVPMSDSKNVFAQFHIGNYAVV